MLDLFEKVDVKQTERLQGEDLQTIKVLQAKFDESIARFDKLTNLTENFTNSSMCNFSNDELTSNFRDKLKKDTQNFIHDTYSYFRCKYDVSLDDKLWDESKFRWNCYSRCTTWEESYLYVKSINYNVILDDIYKQLGTLDFISKGTQEFLDNVRHKLGYKITQKNNKISYTSMVSPDNWNATKINWDGSTYNLELLFRSINYFENEKYELSSWANNFVIQCRSGNKDFNCFSRHTSIPFSEITCIQIYKNGKIDLTFEDYETALKYYNMFWRE